MSCFQRFVCGISIAIAAPGLAMADGPAMVIGPDGKPVTIVQASPSRLRGGTSEEGKGKKEKSGTDSSESETEKEKAKEDDKSVEPKVIRRDETTGGDADPDELKAMVGEDGRVAFQFRNQPWVELVQWLADISGEPLDWLELPGDRVNMRSPGRYTVAETCDLFNRYLLARGYTLLEIDGGLTVAKTDKINPAIVPRVEASELATLQPHTFVGNVAGGRLVIGRETRRRAETDDQQQWSADGVDDHQSDRSDGCGCQFAASRPLAGPGA